MPTALTKLTLDEAAQAGCQAPGCTHEHDHGALYFRAKCHPADQVVSYYRGMLYVACAVCGRPIAKIKVAES